MAKVYDGIDTQLARWIERQPVFFVATAPVAADGLVNLSPKGETGTFRVVDAHTFAYLDLSACTAPAGWSCPTTRLSTSCSRGSATRARAGGTTCGP